MRAGRHCETAARFHRVPGVLYPPRECACRLGMRGQCEFERFMKREHACAVAAGRVRFDCIAGSRGIDRGRSGAALHRERGGWRRCAGYEPRCGALCHGFDPAVLRRTRRGVVEHAVVAPRAAGEGLDDMFVRRAVEHLFRAIEGTAFVFRRTRCPRSAVDLDGILRRYRRFLSRRGFAPASAHGREDGADQRDPGASGQHALRTRCRASGESFF